MEEKGDAWNWRAADTDFIHFNPNFAAAPSTLSFVSHHPSGIKYNVSIAERRFNPRAVLDNPAKLQPQNLTVLPGVETCKHIYFHVMVRESRCYLNMIE